MDHSNQCWQRCAALPTSGAHILRGQNHGTRTSSQAGNQRLTGRAPPGRGQATAHQHLAGCRSV